ncbi:MAG: hypothetical protein PHT71_07740 [Victivallaceae bacterium]|nr:hypothetical protein [Victivallaceae bacterium]
MKIMLLLLIIAIAPFLSADEAKNESGILIRADGEVRKLARIGNACLAYTVVNSEAFPNKPGVSGFELLIPRFLPDYNLLIADFDKVSSPVAVGEKLTEQNTSYAYVGAGLSNGKKFSNGRVETPIAFEKPWLRDDGIVKVLYLGGQVESVRITAATCEDVVRYLREKNYPEDPYWERIIFNARTIDAVHQGKPLPEPPTPQSQKSSVPEVIVRSPVNLDEIKTKPDAKIETVRPIERNAQVKKLNQPGQ